jgi:hypothetical protein
LIDDSKQGLRFHGLGHNGNRPGPLGALRNVAISRRYCDGNVGKPRILASLGEYRHLHVQKNQPRMGFRGGKQPKRLASVRRILNDLTVEREEFSEVFA